MSTWRHGAGRRVTTLALTTWYIVVVAILFAPIVASVVYAFNSGVVGKQSVTWTGPTWQWFPAAWNDMALRCAAVESLSVAFWCACLSIFIGSALGYAMVRHPSKRIRRGLATLTYLLLIVPESISGVSLLLFYAMSRIPLGTATLVAGITPVAVAVVALVIQARMLMLDRRHEEAAADLGSTWLKTFWFIVLPQIAPALGIGAVLAYTVSFDNLVVSAFLTTPRTNALPVYLYGSLQYGPSPAIYAAAAAMFVLTVTLIALAVTIQRFFRSSVLFNLR
jgi:ABC-type spermidine/putrescine transport system permease subunit II